MAFLVGLPSACVSAPWPSGRYLHTNPLRREAGLRLLTESLPDALRWGIVRAWRRPRRYASAEQTLPGQPRARPDDITLFRKSPSSIGYAALVELELARRAIEAPKNSMLPAARNALLTEQSAYLRRLYDTLAWQIGEACALDEFAYLVASIV